jgi:VWFA-related protein
MSVILALDTSVSTKPVIGSIKNAAKEFIRKLGPADLCMVLTFDFKIRVLSPLTADKKALDSSIKKAQAGKTGGTVLNDALYLGINDILKNINGRKAVVVLTDGKDYKSDHRTNDVLDRISGADTVIYPIYFETEDRPASRNPRLFGLGRFSINGRQSNPDLEPTNAAARIFLQQIADLTGGRLFSPAGQKLNDAFNQIADEMKRQYLVGYYPPEDVKTGAIHKLRVQVDRPNTVVRSKAEYRNQSK